MNRRTVVLGGSLLALPITTLGETGFRPPAASEKHSARDDRELSEILANCQEGAHISLSGNFDEARTITKPGLVFRSKSPLEGKIRQRWTIDRSATATMLYQLDFAGNASWPEIRADDFKAYRNRFRDNRPVATGRAGMRLMRTRGRRSDFACNEFTNSAGSIVTFDVVGGARGGRFRRNYVHDIDHRSAGIAAALLACGQSGFDVFGKNGKNIDSRLEIADNLFERIDVRGGYNREALMAKASGVTFVNNTLIRVRGFLNVRIGRNCIISRNWIENSNGIFTFGDGHRVDNNRLVNCSHGIQVFGGNFALQELFDVKLSTEKWEEAASRNCRFARNVIVGNKLEVGARSDASHDRLVADIRVEAHQGDVARGPLDHDSTVETTKSSIKARPARKLKISQAGRMFGL